MITINDKMIHLYNNASLKAELQNSLLSLLKDGFVNDHACYFLKSLFNNSNHVAQNDFTDKTGFECFVNSIHVDDYVNQDHLEQAYIFLKNLFIKWNEISDYPLLKGIISQTEFGANVKFHVIREGEEWIDERHVDLFDEALLIITSKAEVKI